MKVFLGGTCNGSSWREYLLPMLTVEAFNPVVSDWTPDCQAEELKQRQLCDICLYTITPKMVGVYSVAEVVDDSNKRPEKTVLVVIPIDDELSFSTVQLKSLDATARLVIANGGRAFTDLSDAAIYINSLAQ